MEEATPEIVRGVSSHYELEGRIPVRRKNPQAGQSRRWEGPKTSRGLTDLYHAQLWIVGDAIGDACWRKGHAAGIRRKAPAEGKIRADFSLNELLQLSWLAHLGVQYMMPNYRGFEIHRFGGEEGALEGAIAIGKIEGAIPAKTWPFTDLGVQLKNPQKLINDWWQGVPDRLTA